jgi:hypothetical protein|tara:strand:+ start:226 stop:438 length:213 start_codon:yes stop_codon:yes gene_type:complete
MCTNKISKFDIETIIEGLQDAINVCNTAPENPKEQGYPYAAGYSRAAMQTAIENLQTLMYVQEQHDMECG